LYFSTKDSSLGYWIVRAWLSLLLSAEHHTHHEKFVVLNRVRKKSDYLHVLAQETSIKAGKTKIGLMKLLTFGYIFAIVVVMTTDIIIIILALDE
jgi:hypothetical protein